MRDHIYHPCLWREITLCTQQVIPIDRFTTLISRSAQLRTLSLKFCQQVSQETLQVIAEWANPYYLRELYLDGCEKVNDQALSSLTMRSRRDIEIPTIHEFFNLEGQIYIHDFSSIAITKEEMKNTLKDVGEGGVRGLEVLSLAECRNVSDVGC